MSNAHTSLVLRLLRGSGFFYFHAGDAPTFRSIGNLCGGWSLGANGLLFIQHMRWNIRQESRWLYRLGIAVSAAILGVYKIQAILGAGDANNVVLVDTLPAGVTFVSATTPCTEAAGVVTCNLGALANGATAVVEIVVTAPSVAGTITNDATVTADEFDPDLANNDASADTLVEQDIFFYFLPILNKNVVFP